MPLLVPAQSEKAIQLVLRQGFGKAMYRECDLYIGIYDGAGRVSSRCVQNYKEGIELRSERALTAEEATKLLGLVRQSKLMTGGHIGTDTTSHDGLFETLKVTDSTATAGVLVTSGNVTFATGPRRRLLDLLHSLLAELKKSAK